MILRKFLCLVIDRVHGKTLAEYTIESIDWYHARHSAADKYVGEFGDNGNWCVDSLDITNMKMDS